MFSGLLGNTGERISCALLWDIGNEDAASLSIIMSSDLITPMRPKQNPGDPVDEVCCNPIVPN